LQDHLGVPTTLLNTTIFPESAGTLPLSNLIKNVTASALAKAPSPGSDKKRYADRALPGKAGIADGRKRITPGDATSGLSEM
jgi:hypothetical protein